MLLNKSGWKAVGIFFIKWQYSLLNDSITQWLFSEAYLDFLTRHDGRSVGREGIADQTHVANVPL